MEQISEVSFFFRYEDGESSPFMVLTNRYGFGIMLYDLVTGKERSCGKIKNREKYLVKCGKCSKCDLCKAGSRYVWILVKDISDTEKKKVVAELERHKEMMEKEGDKIIPYGENPFFFISGDDFFVNITCEKYKKRC